MMGSDASCIRAHSVSTIDMAEKVYIETTIVSYLTARPATDVVVRGHQELTKLWWQRRAADFHLCSSQFVIDEASAGDAQAARARLQVLSSLELLQIGTDVPTLADLLLAEAALPPKARVDALHLAVATTNGVNYLMTWNCKHLANALLWRKMEQACRKIGLKPPLICTPFELIGDAHDPGPNC